MDINQIKKYWTNSEEQIYTYKSSQLLNSRLLSTTIEYLINCGLPDGCAPGLSFNNCDKATIPTPNDIFNLSFEELNDFLMIGSNGCGDPVCIDLNSNNEIVYLNHDNYFERVFMNSSVIQLAECIIRQKDFHTSLNPQIVNNTFISRKFSNEEFDKLCEEFMQIDNKSLLENSCWKAELNYLLWERDNE